MPKMVRSRTLGTLQANVLFVGLPRCAVSIHRSKAMKWEKPTAIDMRLGFEITMYIANR